MRQHLREFDYHMYGLSEEDFDYIIGVTRSAHNSLIELTQQRIAPLREDPDAVEIVDDQAYYAFVEATFLWEFALWRLQGIFEGLISARFLGGETPHGLRGRLQALRRHGYLLSGADEAELLEWARLRNALSHRPPEQFRPAGLDESDVLEYRDLALRVLASWNAERSDKATPKAPEA